MSEITIKKCIKIAETFGIDAAETQNALNALAQKGPLAAEAGRRLSERFNMICPKKEREALRAAENLLLMSPKEVAEAKAQHRIDMVKICELAKPERKVMDTKNQALEKAQKLQAEIIGNNALSCEIRAGIGLFSVHFCCDISIANMMPVPGTSNFPYAPEKPIPEEGVMVTNAVSGVIYYSLGEMGDDGLRVTESMKSGHRTRRYLKDWRVVETVDVSRLTNAAGSDFCHHCRNRENDLEKMKRKMVCMKCQMLIPANYKYEKE